MTTNPWFWSDPEPLLHAVYSRWPRKSARGEEYDPERLRLFACACLRRLWPLLDDGHRDAVQQLEEYARSPRPGGLTRVRQAYRRDALRVAQEWVRLWDASWEARSLQRALTKWHFAFHVMNAIAGPGRADLAARMEISARCRAASAVWKAAEAKVTTAALACTKAAEAVGFLEASEVARQGGQPAPATGGYYTQFRSCREAAAQADLFRDLFVNPTTSAPAVDRAWLAWNGRTVVQLARAVDKTQEWERLLVLADALEDAGCSDAEILSHLRNPGPHVRGCWVIDLLLGRVL
jgi:hypothetical protein